MASLRVALVERSDALEDCKPGARGPFRVVVMSFRPPEICKDAVAQVLRYKAAEARNRFRGGAEIVSFDFAPFLGIKLRGNPSCADQGAKHDGQMSSLATGVSRLVGRSPRLWSANGRAKRSATFTAELRASGVIC